MKRNFLITSFILLSLTLCIFMILNININKNSNKNKLVVDTFNNLFKSSTYETEDNYLDNNPLLEINGTDYIGVLKFERTNYILPIESKCSNNTLTGLCHHSNNPFVLIGTNLKNSLKDYKEYYVNDSISFTNTLGDVYQYKITKITRIDSLNNLSNVEGSLLIVIKNYYSLEYIVYVCDFF